MKEKLLQFTVHSHLQPCMPHFLANTDKDDGGIGREVKRELWWLGWHVLFGVIFLIPFGTVNDTTVVAAYQYTGGSRDGGLGSELHADLILLQTIALYMSRIRLWAGWDIFCCEESFDIEGYSKFVEGVCEGDLGQETNLHKGHLTVFVQSVGYRFKVLSGYDFNGFLQGYCFNGV
ncbi:hypothetical protein C8J56DRAFT_896915 [Mycena floridula]|nr:hypothetical protein C8J56DRAFT_896915 [Mycena floridula]